MLTYNRKTMIFLICFVAIVVYLLEEVFVDVCWLCVCLQTKSLFVEFLARLRNTEELMSSPVRRRRRQPPTLTFAFRSNVDKLLGPG